MTDVVNGVAAMPADQADWVVAQRLRALGEEASRLAGMLAPLPPGARTGSRARDEGREKSSAEMLNFLIEIRRLRAKHVAAKLFTDPAWDILLDLMDARLKGQPVPISSLCLAADVPATTALRRIQSLCRRGLIVRTADPADRRRVLIQLTRETETRLHAFLDAVRRIQN